jgi:hypothetical protein
MASTLPANAQKVNASTLADALAATSLSSSPSSEAKEINGNANETDSIKEEGELEDGEIKEDEEDDGTVKTVFDNADKFNVKVSLRCICAVVATHSTDISIHCTPTGPCTLIRQPQSIFQKPLQLPQPLRVLPTVSSHCLPTVPRLD